MAHESHKSWGLKQGAGSVGSKAFFTATPPHSLVKSESSTVAQPCAWFRLPSGKQTGCYWKLSFIVDLPIKHGDFPQLCKRLPEAIYFIINYSFQFGFFSPKGLESAMAFRHQPWLPWFFCCAQVGSKNPAAKLPCSRHPMGAERQLGRFPKSLWWRAHHGLMGRDSCEIYETCVLHELLFPKTPMRCFWYFLLDIASFTDGLGEMFGRFLTQE